jgi:sulfopyruvate decarboxylase TPP-binding subunit
MQQSIAGRGVEVARRICTELAQSEVKMIASLPDNWISTLIAEIESDRRFAHVPVNREEAAIGLCAGAYMGGLGSAALMGASGFMTVIYAITKINYSYEIPLLMLITLRGAFGDHHKNHIGNSLYLRPVIEALDLPFDVIEQVDDIPRIGRAYRHSRTFARPTIVALTRDLLRGSR